MRRLHRETLPLEWAQGVAESYVREKMKNSLSLVRKRTLWRQAPASEKQVDFLMKMGIRLPSHLTRGEASELIAKLVWENRLVEMFG